MSGAGEPWNDFAPGPGSSGPASAPQAGPWQDFAPAAPSMAAPPPAPVSTAGSLARNAASGFGSGAVDTQGAFYDTINPLAIGSKIANSVSNMVSGHDVVPSYLQSSAATIDKGLGAVGLDPNSVQPHTWDERLAHNAGIGASAVAFPGGEEGFLANAGRNLATGLVSGIGKDVAEEAAPDGGFQVGDYYVPYKGMAGTAGAILGGYGAAHTMAGTILPTPARDMVTGALGMTTGVGGNAISGAYNAGRAGGNLSAAFTDAMRGRTPVQSVVDDARAALSNLRAARNAEYRSGMVDISKDQSVLDFKPIDAALGRVLSVKNFKGQDLSPNTAAVRSQLQDAVDRWRSLDPNQYHTPEGMDALKQQIGDIRDAQPFHTPQRLVADQVYGAIRNTVAQQAPTYDAVMRDYANASDTVSNIEREMSLGPKGNPNVALRKLQSVMRNNAATGWGSRANLVDTLADSGATTLPAKLAGQSLSQWEPRGLARLGGIGDLGALALTHNPAAAATLPLFSPRMVGEGAHGVGRLVNLMNVRNPWLTGSIATAPSLATLQNQGAP